MWLALLIKYLNQSLSSTNAYTLPNASLTSLNALIRILFYYYMLIIIPLLTSIKPFSPLASSSSLSSLLSPLRDSIFLRVCFLYLLYYLSYLRWMCLSIQWKCLLHVLLNFYFGTMKYPIYVVKYWPRRLYINCQNLMLHLQLKSWKNNSLFVYL